MADASRYGYTDRCHYDTTIRYDANGNIAMDLDRNIVAVEYNILNLPKSITFNTGSRIINEYNAKGEKLSSTFIGLQQPRIKICYNKNHEITYSKTSEALEFTKIKEVVYNNEGYYQYLFNETSPQVSQYYYCRNYLGSNVAVWNANTKQVEQQTMYYATGLPMNNSTGEDVQTHKYNGKEYISQFGLNEYDSQARYYYYTIARTTTMDPLAEKYYHISPYAWCGNNWTNMVDPSGLSWFRNDTTEYISWFELNEKMAGYTYIGEKGSVLGEFEALIDNILQLNKIESLYTNGFTFDIAPTDKGALVGSRERGWDFLDEFVYNEGPEFSILLANHPYTQQMMNDAKVKEGQEQVREKQSFVTAGPSEWGPLSVINPKNWKMAPQFIGTYTYYGAPSADGQHINNVIFDSKNVRSLFLHIPRGSWNKRRSEYTQRFGNTYQFYIWQSLK